MTESHPDGSSHASVVSPQGDRGYVLLPRWAWFALAIAMFGASTYLAGTQEPRPDPTADPIPLTSWDWWRYPCETNASMRLPVITGDLKDVYALPDGKHVWVAGDGGLVLASEDGGDTWKRFELKFERSRVMRESSPSPAQDPTKDGKSPANPVQLPNEPAKKFIYRPDRQANAQANRAANSSAEQQTAGSSAADPNELIDLSLDFAAVHFVTPELGCAFTLDGQRYVATRDGGKTWTFGDDSYVGLARALGVASANENLLDPSHPFWSDPSAASLQPVLFRAIVFARANSDWPYACLSVQPTGEFVRVPFAPFSNVTGREKDELLVLARAVVRAEPYMAWATENDAVEVATGSLGDWLPATEGESRGLTSVHIRDGGGIAVGAGGLAFTIHPQGVTHERLTKHPNSIATRVQVPTTEDLYAVHLVDGSTAWVVGTNGALLSTRDGGASWRTCSRIHHYWNALEFVDRAHGFGVVDSRLVRTRDGGSSWSIVESTADEKQLISLAAGPDALWAVGNGRTLLRSRDGWDTVEKVATPKGEYSESIAFREIAFAQQNGVIVGGAFTPLITRDGGVNWSVPSVGTPVEVIRGLADELWGDRPITKADGLKLSDSDIKVMQLFDGVSDLALKDSNNSDFGRVGFDGRSYWFVRPGGDVERRSERDLSLEVRAKAASSELRTIALIEDRAFVAGESDTLLRSDDGGATWSDPRVYSRSPAPWCWAAWIGVLGLMIPVVRKPRPKLAASGWVADAVVSDRPIHKKEDRLGFVPLAEGISRFLRNAATLPPLTLAITGKWGSGKSSLMNLVRDDLESFGYRSVAFNAWHNQQEEDLLAALLEAIKAQATPEWWRPSGLRFRARLLWIRAKRRRFLIAVTILVLIGSVGFFVGNEGRRRQAREEFLAFTANPLEVISDLVRSLALVSTGNDYGEGRSTSRAEAAEAADAGGSQADARAPSNAAPSPAAPDSRAKPASKEKTQVSLLFASVSFLGLLFGTLRNLHAFGTGATSLFGWIAAPFRKPRAPASAQRRFATEFDEVAQALEPRCPLILIDDLDRCQPKKVLRMIEATNYIVSAGNCFVLLAIERERVEDAIQKGYDAGGKSSTEAREEVILPAAKANGSPRAPANGSASESGAAKESKGTFAKRYLEKLVNIEVPVPTPQVDILSQIVRPMTRDEILAARKTQIVDSSKRAGLRSVVTLGIACMLLGVYLLGKQLGKQPAHGPATATIVNAAVNTTSSPETPLGREKTKDDSAKPLSVLVPPAPRAGSRLFGVLAAIAAASLFGIGAWRLRKRSDPVEYDSQEFTDALAIWQPVAIAGNPTPRAAKRFVNRVRYLATLHADHPGEERPELNWIPEKLRSWIQAHSARAWTGSPQAANAQPAEAQGALQGDGANPVPEADLVALGAMDQFESVSAVDDERKADTDAEATRQAAMARAQALHKEKFGRLPDDGAHRRFALAAQTVRVDG